MMQIAKAGRFMTLRFYNMKQPPGPDGKLQEVKIEVNDGDVGVCITLARNTIERYETAQAAKRSTSR